jgi:hypothetical protein
LALRRTSFFSTPLLAVKFIFRFFLDMFLMRIAFI